MKSFKNMALQGKFALVFTAIVLVFLGLVAVALFLPRIEIIIVVAVSGLILILAMLSILNRNVSQPVAQLLQLAKNLNDDDFKNMTPYDSDDELGQLSDCLARTADSLAKLHEARQTIANYESDLENLSAQMEKILAGDLASVKMGFGKNSRYMATAFVLARTLHEIAADMQGLATAAAAGDFKKRVEAEKYGNDWKKIAQSLNKMMEALAEPIEQAKDVMDNLAAGKLDTKMTAEARGELLKLKTAANSAAASLTKYVKTITHSLENIDKKPRFLSDLPHDFAPIKTAIVGLTDDLAKRSSTRRDAVEATDVRPRTAFGTARTRDKSVKPTKFSGAARLDGMGVNTGETPSYMRPDFGKY